MPAQQQELGRHGGTAAPLTSAATTVAVTSNDAFGHKVVDGNDGAGGFWQSGFCPTSGACEQSATVDLGSVLAVGAVYLKHASGNPAVTSTTYSHSADGATWTILDDTMPPMQQVGSDIPFSPAVPMRYIRVAHTLPDGHRSKVFVWEMTAWDADGKYGVLPAVSASNVSFSKLLGINGIWGWGTSGYTTSLGSGEGAERHATFASHGRNYHNWHWDAADPDDPVQFAEMVGRAGAQLLATTEPFTFA